MVIIDLRSCVFCLCNLFFCFLELFLLALDVLFLDAFAFFLEILRVLDAVNLLSYLGWRPCLVSVIDDVAAAEALHNFDQAEL